MVGKKLSDRSEWNVTALSEVTADNSVGISVNSGSKTAAV